MNLNGRQQFAAGRGWPSSPFWRREWPSPAGGIWPRVRPGARRRRLWRERFPRRSSWPGRRRCILRSANIPSPSPVKTAGSVGRPRTDGGRTRSNSSPTMNWSTSAWRRKAPASSGPSSSTTTKPLTSRSNAPYRVLSSTNLVLPLTNWTPIWTDTFNPNRSGLFTNPVGSTNAQQYFNIVVP